MLFYIRIKLVRSYVGCQSFQARPDKMLYFQGSYSFQRKSSSFLNFLKSIENTGQTGFFGFARDSSQTVVIVASLLGRFFTKRTVCGVLQTVCFVANKSAYVMRQALRRGQLRPNQRSGFWTRMCQIPCPLRQGSFYWHTSRVYWVTRGFAMWQVSSRAAKST